MRLKRGTKSEPQSIKIVPKPSGSTDTFLTDFDLERLTQRARSSWQKARLTGTGPPFVRFGRLVRYRASVVEAWLAAHPSLRSTSDTTDRMA